MKPTSVKASPSSTCTPSASMSATEALAVGRDADVLRHALVAEQTSVSIGDTLGRPSLAVLEAGLGHLQLQVAQHLALDQVDLGHAALELAGEHGVAPVDREVGVVDAAALGHVDRVLHRQGLGIAEVQAVLGLGHHDGDLPSGVAYTL
jgi:hypothetical protein